MLNALTPLPPQICSYTLGVLPCSVPPPTTIDPSTTTVATSRRTNTAPDQNRSLKPRIIAQKAVKRGFKSFRQPQVCGVSFERLPVWLWTFRPSEWSAILITGPDERRLRQVHPLLHNQFGNKFRLVATPFGYGDISKAIVWWVSGTTDFAKSLRIPVKIPTVQWMTGTS